MKCEFRKSDSFEAWSQINKKELDIYFAETGMDREFDFNREVEEERLFLNKPVRGNITPTELNKLLKDVEEEISIFGRPSVVNSKRMSIILKRAVSNGYTLPIRLDCSSCKHQDVSKYVEPCHSCRDNGGYDNYECKI